MAYNKTHEIYKALGLAALIFTLYWWLLPAVLFDAPTCMVLEDRARDLLGARIAADGQWRFPARDTVPQRFAQAVVAFEDRRFYKHSGVDIWSIGRALGQNLRSGRVVSGGSTITMQVIRLARQGKPRSLGQKVIEAILAVRLELSYRKQSILALYASHAPFGGNVVGLDAASWRYFGKRPELLSWGEATTLAVLPNSPALIHPGRNRQALIEKRNRLLDKLLQQGVIDTLTCKLAQEEPLPDAPHPLPRLAPHLLDRAWLEYVRPGKVQQSRIRTTIDRQLQTEISDILSRRQQLLRHNEIHNLAAIVMDVETGQVLAYVGNVIGAGEAHGEQVDVVRAPRSTGSLLKPLLYALALQEGLLLPNSLLQDVPMQLSGYRPENFYRKYDGMTPAARALGRSLNVPFVRLLQDYGLEKFHFQLQKSGMTTLNKPAAHYGLPLVLGGAEGALWELTGIYAGMARTLSHFNGYKDAYNPQDIRPPNYLWIEKPLFNNELRLQKEPPFLSAAAIWFAFAAMQELERPDEEGNWRQFTSSRRLAWKTGTSIGFRDAWAIGVNPRYAVGVWAGNADGEGRPGLIGVQVAAPVLFDIVNRLPESGWFEPPYAEMAYLPVCRRSGYRATPLCEADTTRVPQAGWQAPACPFHQTVHLDPTAQWQVNADCENPNRMVHRSWFVLPPLEEHYFRSKNPTYRVLPPFRADCTAGKAQTNMQLIYPKYPTRIYVPIDLNGRPSRTVFTVAHRRPETTVYWHIDEAFVGSTQTFHSMELNPPEGKHLLTLVDEKGNRLEQAFEIIVRQQQ
ncbi:MAG TPA: penicillin-binding protein 1C [Saprospiraceae bacterium]|nr:penicillin-binding protein 1C [Saprospiraceae bacterium]HMP22873.1 penicillin-binding protein 1C [Saprospiraceae bacterium]